VKDTYGVDVSKLTQEQKIQTFEQINNDANTTKRDLYEKEAAIVKAIHLTTNMPAEYMTFQTKMSGEISKNIDESQLAQDLNDWDKKNNTERIGILTNLLRIEQQAAGNTHIPVIVEYNSNDFADCGGYDRTSNTIFLNTNSRNINNRGSSPKRVGKYQSISGNIQVSTLSLRYSWSLSPYALR
jgi:hypothetical protein